MTRTGARSAFEAFESRNVRLVFNNDNIITGVLRNLYQGRPASIEGFTTPYIEVHVTGMKPGIKNFKISDLRSIEGIT